MINVLEVGEIMQEGDEWYDYATGQGGGEPGWNPVRVMIGLPVTEGSLVRRPKAEHSKACPTCGGSGWVKD